MNTEDGALYVGMGTDNKEFISAIQEAERRVKDFSNATVAEGSKINKTLNSITQESVKMSNSLQKEETRELGLIADLEQALTELREKRKNAHSIEEITKYNQKIKEAEQDLRSYTEAGIKQAEVSETLTQSVGKWALTLGGAGAILGVLKDAFKETTGGMNLFNTVGAATKQVLYDIVSGAGLSIAKLQSAISLQRELNDLKAREYGDSYQAEKLNTEYQRLYSESLDQTLSGAERLKLIDQALAAHNASIDLQIKNVKENLSITARSLINRPDDDKLKKEYADLMMELQRLEAQRYSETKRLTSQRSGIIKDEIDKEKKWRKDLHDDLQKLADEEIEINKKKEEEVRIIRNQIALASLDGLDKEKERVRQKYEDDLVKYKDNEEAKKLLHERYLKDLYLAEKKYLEDIKKENEKLAKELKEIYPASIIDKALTGRGEKPWDYTVGSNTRAPNASMFTTLASSSATWAKKTKKDAEDANNDQLDNELELRKQITGEVKNLVYQLGEASGMSQEGLTSLSAALQAFSSSPGDWIGAASTMLSGLISLIPDQAEKFQRQIDRINASLEKQQRLIDLSSRTGGESEAREKEIEILRQARDATFQALATERGKLNQNKERIDELTVAWEDYKIKIEDAEQALSDFTAGGITQTTITDAIALGFEDGKTSIDDFASYTNQSLKDAVLNVFKAELLGPSMDELTSYIKNALSDKILTPEEKAEIDKRTKQIADNNKELWTNLTGALGIDEGEVDKALSGSIKGISEGTASAVAGQMNAMRITQADTNNMIRQQLMHLSEIAANTRYLQSIDSKLGADSLRAQGIN